MAQEGDFDTLNELADGIAALLDPGAGGVSEPEDRSNRLAAGFTAADAWVFLGHGPHAATARQCAMMLAEWAKQPVLDFGIGAFRHGFVETAGPGMAALVFASPGRTAASAHELASTLAGRGVFVLVVENGRVRGLDEPSTAEAAPDEFLSPLLDVVPLQLFAAALARERLEKPGFRYISKVVGDI